MQQTISTKSFSLALDDVKKIGLWCFLFAISAAGRAQEYPFPGVPNPVVASMNIDVKAPTTPFNNRLLGTNIFGFSSDTQKSFINQFDPVTVRFPHGLFANWYDWRTDGTRIYGDASWPIDHKDSVVKMQNDGSKVGIEGLTELNSARKATRGGKGYDMLWTFNMSADGTDFNNSDETIARYRDLISRGFEVNDIELGNENFYKGQRSSIIPTAKEYILRAKSMSQALKAQNPNVKVSIPLLRRGSFVNPAWNADLTEDQTYFDAITVHQYIGADPDDSTNSINGYGEALRARAVLETAINKFVSPYSNNKPIWLSEWGVKSGGINAASVLGMADVYLYMSQNQDIYQRANWFSVNGLLNRFVVMGEGRQPVYPLEKTLYASTHEVVRSVLENSAMLNNTMTTHELTTGVNAISARAVIKNGKVLVLALNMTDSPANLSLKFNGVPSTRAYQQEAMTFSSLAEERNLPINDDPLNYKNSGKGQINLPPYSINKIILADEPASSKAASSKPASSKPVSSVASSKIASSKAVASTPASSEPTSSAPSTACGKTINVARGARVELTVDNATCVKFDRDLTGHVLQVWDSEINTSCDYKGTISSVDGTGSLTVSSTYVISTSFTGSLVKFANSNNCKFIKLRVY